MPARAKVARGVLVIGAGLLGIGVSDALRWQLASEEKTAYLVFGHWVDAVWEVQVPLIVLGTTVTLLGWLIGRRGRRAK